MNNRTFRFLGNDRRLRSLLASAGLLATATTAFTQAAGLDLKDPIITRMPERSSWTLSLRQPPAAKPSAAKAPAGNQTQPSDPPSVLTATISKDGKIYRVVFDKPFGGYREVWSIDGVVLAVTPAGDRAAMVSPFLFPLCDFSSSDFEDFQWVGAKDAVGLQTVGNRPMLAFKADNLTRPLTARESFMLGIAEQNEQIEQKASEEEPEKPAEKSPEAKQPGRKKILRLMGWKRDINAWLDPQTRRPLLMASGDYLLSVAYTPAAVPLTPPPFVLDRIAREKQRTESFTKRSSKPRP